MIDAAMIMSLAKAVLAAFAIYTIGAIMRDAMKLGMNGKALALSVASIAGLGGIMLGNLLTRM